MAKLTLSKSTFSVIPEGTHIFKITEVEYKEQFGKLNITMETQSGLRHTERFSLLKANGESNEKAMNAFSYFARVALNDFSAEEIDPVDLTGHYIECDVEHDVQPSNKDPNKTVTFAGLTEKRPSEGWGEVKTASAPPEKPKVITEGGKPKFDLKKVLG